MTSSSKKIKRSSQTNQRIYDEIDFNLETDSLNLTVNNNPNKENNDDNHRVLKSASTCSSIRSSPERPLSQQTASLKQAKQQQPEKLNRKNKLFTLTAARNLLKLFTRKKIESSSTELNVTLQSPKLVTCIRQVKKSKPLTQQQQQEKQQLTSNLTQRIPVFNRNISNSNHPSTKTYKFVQIVLDRQVLVGNNTSLSCSNSPFGFTVLGYCPCQVGKIEKDSIAVYSGLLQGDLIIKINGRNVSRATSDSISKIIKNFTEQRLILDLYRPEKKPELTKRHRKQQQPTQPQPPPPPPPPQQQQQQRKSLVPSVNGIVSSSLPTPAFMLGNSTENSTDLILNTNFNNNNNNNNLYSTKLISTDSLNHRYKYKKSNIRHKTRKSDNSPSTKFKYSKHISIKKQKLNNREELNDEDENEFVDYEEENEELNTNLPSPIPFLPPLQQQQQQQQNNLDSLNSQYNKHNLDAKKTSITDSDYRTQSSTMTTTTTTTTTTNSTSDLDNLAGRRHKKCSDDDFHMLSCERLLNLEEKFIEQMQKGVQQYSRPLRHCLMINQQQHQTLFQNIEKILAISEYQLNQLISQDDSTLFDMFNTIGKLYENKMRMSCEAFDIYLSGVEASFDLLNSLIKQNSNHFSKFLNDCQDDVEMSLKEFLLLPLSYVANVNLLLNEIKLNDENKVDLISLSSLLNRLDAYVTKSNEVLFKFNLKLNSEMKNNDCVWSGEMKFKQCSLNEAKKWRRGFVQIFKDQIRVNSVGNDVNFAVLNLRHIKKMEFDLESKNEFQLIHDELLFRFRTDFLDEKKFIKSLFK